MKKGLTIIELIIAIAIAGMGLVAVTSLLYTGWKDWYESKEIKELQEDMDIASINIKAVIEEGNYYEIQDIIQGSLPEKGRRIYVKFSENNETLWEKMFYANGNNLILEDKKNAQNEIIIKTLKDLSFSNVEQELSEVKNTIKVEITVGKGNRNFKNEFFVNMRNK